MKLAMRDDFVKFVDALGFLVEEVVDLGSEFHVPQVNPQVVRRQEVLPVW
jgi:hypothetical protein